jgi:hypothetical protein
MTMDTMNPTTPSPDPQQDALQELARRIAAHWAPDCWFAFVIEALPESIEQEGEDTVHHPPHFLVGVWEPVPAPPLGQLPNAAAIVSRTAQHAAAELLRLVPKDAKLLMLRREDVNAALIADMILCADSTLDGYYRSALEAFVVTERERWRAMIASDYTDRDEGFEKFKSALFGNLNPD